MNDGKEIFRGGPAPPGPTPAPTPSPRPPIASDQAFCHPQKPDVEIPFPLPGPVHHPFLTGSTCYICTFPPSPSPQTTCNAALKKWEEDNGEALADAKVVKLYCQMPPIQKLDNSLNNLKACEYVCQNSNTGLRRFRKEGES